MKIIAVQLFFIIASAYGQHDERKPSDALAVGTAFAGAVQAGSKYFQYAHTPAKDHYEAGHKRGNEHHFVERHEVAHPHEGQFKTKVRWGDKKGGYGEHYWDYNHDGHQGGYDEGGEETQHNEHYLPYHDSNNKNNNNNNNNKEEYVNEETTSRLKRNFDTDDVEFVNEDGRQRVLSGLTGRHGGNYKRARGLERTRRQFD